MDSLAVLQPTMITGHLVALPYPGRGHINPLLNFCNVLATKQPNILISVIVTEEWLGLLTSETKQPANIQFITIPNVLPSELVRGADHSSFVKAIETDMRGSVERVIEQLRPRPIVIVYDVYLSWGVGCGLLNNIPVAGFWPTSARMFSLVLHYQLMCQNGHLPVRSLSEQGENQIDYIPGVPTTRVLDLPTTFYGRGTDLLYYLLDSVSSAQKADYHLFTSVYEIEQEVIEFFKTELSVPVYTIGPAIPYFQLKHYYSCSHTDNQNVPGYIKWLDNQAENSVLYISQGSFLSLSDDQLNETIAGIHDSGVHYLWVTRIEDSRFSCDKGLVVPWCDQLRVLCHPSVGGFWTHCGWNSTIEGVFAGVPMLTTPLAFDQVPNSKMIVEDWKIGWTLKRRSAVETLVKRDEIAGLLKRFMDLENGKMKEIRERVKHFKEISQQAVAQGGSANTSIDAFIRDITKF